MKTIISMKTANADSNMNIFLKKPVTATLYSYLI